MFSHPCFVFSNHVFALYPTFHKTILTGYFVPTGRVLSPSNKCSHVTQYTFPAYHKFLRLNCFPCASTTFTSHVFLQLSPSCVSTTFTSHVFLQCSRPMSFYNLHHPCVSTTFTSHVFLQPSHPISFNNLHHPCVSITLTFDVFLQPSSPMCF